MSKIRTSLLAATAAVSALALGASPAIGAVHPEAQSPIAASPYLYNGWGSPPNPTEVMNASGVRDFTLAFINSDGSCNPAWDGTRPLDGQDKTTIDSIRAAGGDVVPSIGGYSGNKLGDACADAQSLAGAYQKVIDAYQLKAIDIDIESTEFETEATRSKVVEALKLVKDKNPNVLTVVTFPTTTTGPNDNAKSMISKAKELGANIDVWTQMPFDFNGTDMGQDTITATDALKDVLEQTLGYSDQDAYAHAGISSMNGKTDQQETIDQAAFQKMADYAKQNGLGRFTFWSINRDRPCSGGAADSCSNIDQQPWDFAKIVASFRS